MIRGTIGQIHNPENYLRSLKGVWWSRFAVTNSVEHNWVLDGLEGSWKPSTSICHSKPISAKERGGPSPTMK